MIQNTKGGQIKARPHQTRESPIVNPNRESLSTGVPAPKNKEEPGRERKQSQCSLVKGDRQRGQEVIGARTKGGEKRGTEKKDRKKTELSTRRFWRQEGTPKSGENRIKDEKSGEEKPQPVP